VDQETRQNMGKRRSPKGGGRITCRRRNRRRRPSASASSDEEFRQPGSAIGSGVRGELVRRGRAFIGVARGRNGQVLIEN
jgi:hypothetical protein